MRADDHPCAGRLVGLLIDHDEAARLTAAPVFVEHQRSGGPQDHPPDVVEAQLRGGFVAMERRDVDLVAERLDCRPDAARGVLDDVPASDLKRRLVHPADRCLESSRDRGAVAGPADQIAPRHVEVVGQADRDRHRRVRLFDLVAITVDRGDRAGLARWEHSHFVADPEDTARDLAGIGAVVVVLPGHRPDDPLHREPGVDQVAVGGDVNGLEVIEERRSLVPRHAIGAVNDVVAVEGRDRDECHVGDLELCDEVAELVGDRVEHAAVVADQVHLVDADDQVTHAQQRGDERMPLRLLDDAMASVHQDDRDVGGRRTGDHVSRVTNVAGGVGEDELAPGGREVAVRRRRS